MSGKQFATILVITFIVGTIWLIFDIIHNVKPSVPVNPKIDVLLQPINPNFNPRILEIIQNEVSDTNPVPSLLPVNTPPPVASAQPSRSPSPSSLPSPSPSPSASPSPSQVALPSPISVPPVSTQSALPPL